MRRIGSLTWRVTLGLVLVTSILPPHWRKSRTGKSADKSWMHPEPPSQGCT